MYNLFNGNITKGGKNKRIKTINVEIFTNPGKVAKNQKQTA